MVKERFVFVLVNGHVPIELNKELAFIIESSKKIGLTVQESNILLPQKSMIGLIGLGDNRKEKTCQNCLHIKIVILEREVKHVTRKIK